MNRQQTTVMTDHDRGAQVRAVRRMPLAGDARMQPSGTLGATLARRAGLLLLSGLMAGCSSFGNNKSVEMMERQQEQHALAQRYENEQLRRNAPDEPGLMMGMIHDLQGQGRYFASLAYMDAYVGQFGANSEIQAMRAHALRMTGQFQDSETVYRSLLNTGMAARGWHGLGLLAGERGDYAGAIPQLEKAARLAPTQSQVLNDLGYARLRAGQLAQARLPLGQAAELDPGNKTVLANLALLLLLDGNEAGAQRLMQQADLSPEARVQVRQLADDMSRPVALAAPDVQAGVPALSSASSMQVQPTATTPGQPQELVVASASSADAQESLPVVRAVAASSQPAVTTGASAGWTPQTMPRTQRRVLEGFGNPPAAQAYDNRSSRSQP